MPTVQAPYGDTDTGGGTTVANTLGNQPEPPTVIPALEVLEPTVAAPQMPPQPAFFSTETVAAPPEMAPLPEAPGGGDYMATIAAGGSLETQSALEEEVDVTITTINESPAKLIVSRNGQSREFLLKKSDISIGRAPSNDIALSGDQLASRRHALIHFDGVNYVIRDLVSANGTYINGVELRSPTPLSNGDHVGVGEHELVFFSVADNAAEPETMTFHQTGAGDFNPETIPVPGQADTIDPAGVAYLTQGDSVPSGAWGAAEVTERTGSGQVSSVSEEEMVTEGVAGEALLETITYEEQAQQVVPPPMAPEQVSSTAMEMPEATIIERIELIEQSSAGVVEEEEVEEEEVASADISLAQRLQPDTTPNEEDMPLPVPQLPEIPAILTAIKSLDSTTAEMRENLRRAKALEEEAEQLRDLLREATDAISGHDNSVAVLASRLRVGVADVSNRLNKVIEEVQRADESLSIADMMKLIDDVRNDPRDIYTLGSLARRARELAQFFEMHQHVNQILSECLTKLNSLLAPELANPDAEMPAE